MRDNFPDVGIFGKPHLLQRLKRLTPRGRKRIIIGSIATALIVFLIAGFILGVNWWMITSTRGQLVKSMDDLRPDTVVLVPGARVYSDGRLSGMLEDRVRLAADLYKAGKAKKLLMSGDNSKTHYDEVTAMRNYAIKLGVPPDDVVRDFAGFRTYDSIVRARDIWDLKSLIIVSQAFHLPRSLFLAKQLGIDAQGIPADRRKYAAFSRARAQTRETVSRTLAWLDIYLLKPSPHFLGHPEALSGLEQEKEEQRERVTRTGADKVGAGN